MKTADVQIESLTAVPPEEKLKLQRRENSNRVPLLVMEKL
jgi:hypothetical protein